MGRDKLKCRVGGKSHGKRWSLCEIFGQRTRSERDIKTLPLARKDVSDVTARRLTSRPYFRYGWRALLFTGCMWIFCDSAALCEKRRRNTANSGGGVFFSNKREGSNRGCGSTTVIFHRWQETRVRECFRVRLISKKDC
jgi:hypothetical protein